MSISCWLIMGCGVGGYDYRVKDSTLSGIKEHPESRKGRAN
jgi:hypothetical protein